jgi:hypothetical protein
VDRVFGLLQNDHVDEAYILRLLPWLGPGASELYSHPDNGPHQHETEALCSPLVRQAIDRHGIRLVRYQDLGGGEKQETNR